MPKGISHHASRHSHHTDHGHLGHHGHTIHGHHVGTHHLSHSGHHSRRSHHSANAQFDRSRFEEACVGAVFVLYPETVDGCCGLPGTPCKDRAATCKFDGNSLPNELNGIVSLEDFSAMITELNYAFDATHIPLLPCALFGLLAICTIGLCHCRRQRKIKEILDKYNARIDGYSWMQPPAANPILGIAILKPTGANVTQKQPPTFDGIVCTTVVEAVPVGIDASAPPVPVVAATAMKREY